MLTERTAQSGVLSEADSFVIRSACVPKRSKTSSPDHRCCAADAQWRCRNAAQLTGPLI